jgi:hypothetical protein
MFEDDIHKIGDCLGDGRIFGWEMGGCSDNRRLLGGFLVGKWEDV